MLAGLATPDPDVTQMLSAARPRSRAGGRSAQTRPPDPAKVVIQNVPDELETGERASLAGLVVDATGSTLERELEWSSTSPDVVSVEGDPPTLTGIGPGTARIRASVRGSAVGAEAGVRVIEARACTLELSATSLNLEVGEQSRIIAVPRDRRGASVAETVHWSSADSAIAAASATGIVTGHRIGTTELTATIGELHRIATVTVGAAAVTSILVSPVKATVVTGDALRIEAMPCDRRGSTLADRPVTWSSRSPGIASVTADGIVTGWAEGTVEIVAVCEDVSAVVSLRIEAPAVTRLELEGVPAEIRPGQRFRLAATAVNTRDEKSAAAAEWKSSRSRVASVTRDGVVETHRPGRAVVAARSGTLEAKAELNVLPALQPVVPARKPESGGRTRRIAAGVLSIAAVLAALVFTIQSIQANATPEDQPGVTEDQQSGTAEGTTTGDPPVAVAEEDSSTASPDTGTGREQDIGEPGRGGAIPILVLDAPSRQIAVGDSMVVEAEFRGPTTATAGQRLTWATSDARIATVSAAGLVRGVSAGEVRITAGNAATADTVMVRVSPRRVAVRRVEVTPVAPSVMVGETISLTVRTLDDEGQPLADRNVAWTSSNRQVATVDGGTGMVTGLRPGNAVITAESEAAQTSITLRVADPPAPPPVQPTDSAGGRDPEPLRFASVSAGGGTCASVVDGPALCWGFGNEGTQPAENGFDALVAGWGHRCGLRSGQAFCWGANDHGQIGDGTTTAHSTPTPVAGGGRFVQIAAGEFHTCAIDGQGAAHCWGENDVGQLGTGSARDSPTPARVDEATPFVAIATGRAHTCALDGGSRAWCWGDGLNGQIGNGMTQHQREPVPVRTDDRFRMIAAGGDFTCGLTVGGKAMCWGNNNDGQLGDTRNRLRDEPRDVARETEFQSITTGRHHACALSTDGRVYCWGANGRGQLGTGTTSANSAPSPVEGPVRFTAVTAGNLHTCGLARDGAVYCWGDNSFGQIEQGGAPNHTTPFAIRMTR
jgi:uncharacterized protein YjdB